MAKEGQQWGQGGQLWRGRTKARVVEDEGAGEESARGGNGKGDEVEQEGSGKLHQL